MASVPISAWAGGDGVTVSLSGKFQYTSRPLNRGESAGTPDLQDWLANFEALLLMVTIRLTRRGGKKQPFYHVMVTDSRKRQGGVALEQVGFFDPIPQGKSRGLQLNLVRVDYWVGKGAKLSDRVSHLVADYRKQAAA